MNVLKKEKLTYERVHELFNYNPETGIVTWIKPTSNRVKQGSTAGSINSLGYFKIGVDYKTYLLHRLAFLWMEGFFPENGLDHIDRDRLNNKWTNLREASQQCNIRNCNIFKSNTSGIIGVGWHKQTRKWRASIMVSGKDIHIGLFNTKIEAAQARWEAEVKYCFPNCNTTSSAFQYVQKMLGRG